MKPFLKWPGGKYKLIKELSKYIISGKRLVEPFVGAGSIFLNIHFGEYWINDINPDLINVYECLKNEKGFIEYCKSLFFTHDETTYYNLREEFNNKQSSKERLASIFIYLNRHGFNGLCRYNSKGKYNVPFGKYKTIYFPEEEMKNAVKILQRTKITCESFEDVINDSEENDVIYCDPPYIPINTTSNFTSYSKETFGIKEQKKIAELCRGKNAVISNSYCKESLEIFSGATIYEIEVRRNISCKNREIVKEIIGVFRK